MDGDFKHRHHEVHRTKLYFPDETTFTAPKKCVDAMRQMRTSVDSASKHTLNDYWDDQRKVLPSENE